MSFDALSEVNWLAIIVGTIAWFALGGIWYAPPIFGNVWMRSTGIDPSAEGQRPGAGIYLFPLVAYFVATIALAMLAAATGSETFGEGIVLGLVVGVGFAVTLYSVESVFGRRPQPGTWFLLTAAYQLIGILIATVVVTVWD
jgi:hypothetical protein